MQGVDEKVSEVSAYVSETLDQLGVEDKDKKVLGLLDVIESLIYDKSIKDVARSSLTGNKICVIFEDMDGIEFTEGKNGLELDYVESSEKGNNTD